MTISITIGSPTSTAKNSDLSALQAAINDELKLYATKAEIEALKTEVATLRQAIVSTQNSLPTIQSRIDALEAEPDAILPPDLTTRVEALEAMIQRVPAESPNPLAVGTEMLPRPAGLPPDEVTLIYDRATLYLHDMELHAVRIDQTKWRLVAQLNFVVVSPVSWTYDEIVEGTPEEVYEHAQRRLQELAELKPQHDAVHERVRAMSEGRS